MLKIKYLNLNLMKKITILSAIVLTTLLLFTSCTKESPEPIIVEVTDVKLSSINDFAYYSFKQKNLLDITTPSNDLNWDIAFWGLSGKTNGGTSGKGVAAVIRTKCKDFKKIISAAPFINSEYWVQDTKLEVETVEGNAVTHIKKSLNPFLQNKSYFTIEKDPLKVTINSDVFIIRTAKGRYVKAQFRDSGELGAVLFRWGFIDTVGENLTDVEIYKQP